MDFQPFFRRFEESIKLQRYEENKELVERGQVVLDHVRKNLKVPHTFQPVWQGSYAIGTGIRPIRGDYDIDVSVEFNVRSVDHPPTTVKGWVYEALKTLKPIGSLTVEVAWRGPCITVYYRESKAIKYHVDLAVMAQGSSSQSVCLARGKQNAAPPDQSWEADERRAFIRALEQDFTGADGEQFRRVVRYLKRWKDEQFPADGVSAPSGFALTVAASKWFRPVKQDDLTAMQQFVTVLRQQFVRRYDPKTQREMHRLTLKFSHAPYDDVMKKMSDELHQQFYQRLDKLAVALEQARTTKTTEPLCKIFGKDFPAR